MAKKKQCVWVVCEHFGEDTSVRIFSNEDAAYKTFETWVSNAFDPDLGDEAYNRKMMDAVQHGIYTYCDSDSSDICFVTIYPDEVHGK